MEDLKLEDDEPMPSRKIGVGPLLTFLSNRQMGTLGRRVIKNQVSSVIIEPTSDSTPTALFEPPTSDEVAEERLIAKEPLSVLTCKLMGTHTRSTFLMVFSPDKELVASTHGDHNIYISEVKTGECIQTLKGHPRTPWCLAFHPSHVGLLASGCLGGHVRIWDLNGGSELWTIGTDNAINSLAFHPIERLLVVASMNELYFWDWSMSEPFCKVATRSLKEKVRYVKFDSMGHHLITGIANWPHGSFRNYNAVNERHSFSQQQAAMARAQARRPYSTWNQNDTAAAGGAIYGRYFRGNILRPQPISPASSSSSVAIPPTTSSSASQTLSDLAAAASDQLMAENAAAIAADAAEAAAEAAAVLPRMRRLTEDPLLSDHPYGTQMARRPPPTTPNSLQQDPLLSDHPYGSPTGGRPPPTGLANSWDNDVWLYRPMRTIPPLEEIYQRERRVQQLLMTFRHSQDSSFVEVNRDGQGSAGSSNAGAGSMSSNELLSQIRERRMQRRNFARRQFLLDRIIKRRLETNTDSGSANASSNTRPIDEWAINRRLALQQASNQDNYNSRPSSSSQQAAAQVSTDDNDDADSITAQFGDIPNPTPMEPDVTLRPMSTVDATIRPSSSANNDHNYTMSPGGTSSTSSATSPVGGEASTSSSAQAEPQPSTSNGASSSSSMSSSAANIHNKYIALFNRQLKQMQRICKDSLADCAASRRRRQMVRLQSIENILEDLQKQIRSLRAASNEELQRTRTSTTNSTPSTSRNNNNNEESDEDEELETTAQLGLDERNYDERVGEGYHMRSLARSGRLTRALNRLSSEPHHQRHHHRNNLHRANDRLNSAHNQLVSHMRANNRLSRVHNQLVSQMRATYRAIEMSPDLNQRGKSPLANAKVKTSQEVMERTAKTAAVVSKGNSSTKQELCALSQRLERMLREKRESRMTTQANSDQAELNRPTNTEDMPAMTPPSPNVRGTGATPRRDYVELNIPRPDPLPLDPRHRWRHMYDGSLQFPTSGLFAESGAVDSSESGSESDLDPQALASGGRGRDVHRSQRFLFPRRHSPRNLRWGGGAGGPLDQRFLHSRYGRHYLTASSTLPSSTLTSDHSANINEGNRLDIADLEAAERLPPLRELIWRRLRRRGASLRLEDDSESLRNSGQMAVRSHREGLSRMVDQMRIDQSTNTANGAQPPPSQADSSMTFSRSIPSVPIPPGSYWQGMNDPYNHGSFRSQYVNRIRTDDPPRMSMSRSFEPNTFSTTSHRIQAWNFAKGDIPDLTDSDSNIVVMDAKISNDASVDISDDGSLLVTLRPSDLPNTTAVGVYGLCQSNKGRCFATYSLSDEYSQQPVSVSLSPTSKHLMVGYSGRIPCSRRTRLSPRSLMARIFQLKMPWECLITNPDHQASPKGRLIRKRDLHQTEPVETSLNCIRWIPVAGLGMVYATDTGLLKILR